MLGAEPGALVVQWPRASPERGEDREEFEPARAALDAIERRAAPARVDAGRIALHGQREPAAPERLQALCAQRGGHRQNGAGLQGDRQRQFRQRFSEHRRRDPGIGPVRAGARQQGRATGLGRGGRTHVARNAGRQSSAGAMVSAGVRSRRGDWSSEERSDCTAGRK